MAFILPSGLCKLTTLSVKLDVASSSCGARIGKENRCVSKRSSQKQVKWAFVASSEGIQNDHSRRDEASDRVFLANEGDGPEEDDYIVKAPRRGTFFKEMEAALEGLGMEAMVNEAALHGMPHLVDEVQDDLDLKREHSLDEALAASFGTFPMHRMESHPTEIESALRGLGMEAMVNEAAMHGMPQLIDEVQHNLEGQHRREHSTNEAIAATFGGIQMPMTAADRSQQPFHEDWHVHNTDEMRVYSLTDSASEAVESPLAVAINEALDKLNDDIDEDQDAQRYC